MNHTIHSIKKHLLAGALLGAGCSLSSAAVLYTYAGQFVNNNNAFVLPSMTLSRGGTSTDTLYFRYTVTNPASNKDTENYYAGMSLYSFGAERLGIGNGWDPYAYSAFGTAGNVDLKSANPDGTNGLGVAYQLVESTDITTFVFKIAYNNAGDDSITVWLNPDLNLSEGAQSAALTTTFTANAAFNEIMLREGDDGVGLDNPAGWNFSNIAIAETFSEIAAVPEPSSAMFCALGGLALLRRRRRN